MFSIEAEDLASTSLRLDSTPVALAVPSGSAVFCSLGEVWITQEGMYDDVVLTAGARFDVRGSGRLVISATHGSAVVYIARGAEAEQGRGQRTPHDALDAFGHWVAQMLGLASAKTGRVGH